MANRYWVDGGVNNNWTDTSNWSTSAGGAGGASVPTASDDVFFEEIGGIVHHCYINNGTPTCHDVNFTRTVSGLTLFYWTQTGSKLTISGSIIGNGYKRNSTGTYEKTIIEFTSTGSEVIDNLFDASGEVDGSFTFSGTGTWSLQSAITTKIIKHTAGTITTNNYSVTCTSLFSTGDTSRTLNLGSSTITVGNGLSTYETQFTGTNLTLNEGTSTLAIYRNLLSAGHTFYNVTSSGGNCTITGANTFNNLNSGSNIIRTDYNQIINGTLTCGGIIGDFDTRCTGTTITAAIVSLASDSYFFCVNAAGAAAPFTGTNLQDGGFNQNITFTYNTRYWVGNGGNWTDTSHWSLTSGGTSGASVPDYNTNVVFDANSFSSDSQTVTIGYIEINKITTTGVTNSPTFYFTSYAYLKDSTTIESAVTITSDTAYNYFVFYNNTSITVSLGDGREIPMGANFFGCDGTTVTLGSDFLMTGFSVEIYDGTFDANDHDVKTGDQFWYAPETNGTLFMGAGTWTLKEYVDFYLYKASVSAETSTVVFDMSEGDLYLGMYDGLLVFNNVEVVNTSSNQYILEIFAGYYNSTESSVSYYADGSATGGVTDPDNVWTNEANIADGAAGTYGYTSTAGDIDNNYVLIDGTNVTVTANDLEHPIDDGGSAAILMTVYFRDSGGTEQSISGYVPRIPEIGGNTWAKIQKLKTKIWIRDESGTKYVEAAVYDEDDFHLKTISGYSGTSITSSPQEITRVTYDIAYETGFSSFSKTDPIVTMTNLEVGEFCHLSSWQSGERPMYIKTTDLTTTGTLEKGCRFGPQSYGATYYGNYYTPEDYFFLESTNAPNLTFTAFRNVKALGSTPFDATDNCVDLGYNVDIDFGDDFVPQIVNN